MTKRFTLAFNPSIIVVNIVVFNFFLLKSAMIFRF